MQVKKFEAPTIQEALETIKRELGPEAIILHTKKNRKGFGLLGNGSVEVTAAVSERALQKKGISEKKLPPEAKEKLRNLPADRQAEVYDKQLERMLARQAATTRDEVSLGASRPSVSQAAARAAAQAQDAGRRAAAMQSAARAAVGGGISPEAKAAESRVTRTPYIDIDADTRPMAGQAAGVRAAVTGGRPAARGAVAGSMPLEEEVQHLKRMLVELKEAQDSSPQAGARVGLMDNGFTPAAEEVFDQLVMGGMERKFALQLIRKAVFELGEERANSEELVVDQVAAEVMEATKVKSILGDLEPRAKTGRQGPPAVIALVGPTGVGKTTTIAKLASEAILRRNLKVGLVNLDSYKVAAFDQLATYAKILNVPFRSAQSADDVQSALGDFKGLDLVIIDTTGRSQRDPGSLKEMQELLAAIPGIRTELVVSATTRDAELYDIANRFSIFRPEGLIVSKLDEATVYGAIYNVCQRSKLPLIAFTTGQRVPEDIEEASRERVAALVLEL